MNYRDISIDFINAVYGLLDTYKIQPGLVFAAKLHHPFFLLIDKDGHLSLKKFIIDEDLDSAETVAVGSDSQLESIGILLTKYLEHIENDQDK